MPASPIRKLVPYAEQAKKEGKTIYHLNIGQPDIETPEVMLKAIKNFQPNIVEYSHSAGIESYRRKLAGYYKTYNIEVDYSDIMITTGGSEAIQIALMTCLNNGDELIIPEPFYANYNGFATLADVVVKPIISSIETGFALPPISEFEKLITPKTKGIMICNPGNPTGYLYSKEELLALRDLVKKHDLFLFSDEVYREFVYEVSPSCILQIAPKHERIIIIDSLSKRYSLCGARIGCIISHNKEVIAAATNLASTRVSAPSLEQFAAAHMFENLSETYIRDVVAEYKARRDVLVSGLKLISGVELNAPEGGFYALVKLPVNDARDFAQFMVKDFSMNDETVCISPASGFFFNTKPITNYARIAFVVSIPELQRSVKIIEHALIVYTSKN